MSAAGDSNQLQHRPLPKERLPDELFATLLSRDGIRIERIVSTGQASPSEFWYDQPEEE